MREGSNPAKENPQLGGYRRHRIIIPIYIPNQDGYFAHSLEVLKLCLESLRLTAAGKASVTLISNGCCPEVLAELERQRQQGWVDQFVVNQLNRGKVDSVVTVARGCFEDFITVSDCDILFFPGWVEETRKVFSYFPECGFLSPFPNGVSRYYTHSAVLASYIQRTIRFAYVTSDVDLTRLAQGVDRDPRSHTKIKQKQMVIFRDGYPVCIGGGHCCFTIRKAIVKAMPLKPSCSAISSKTDEMWFDAPPDVLGYWRLGTTRLFAFHMGNIPLSWYYEEIQKYPQNTHASSGNSYNFPTGQQRLHWTSHLPWRVRIAATRLLFKVMLNRFV